MKYPNSNEWHMKFISIYLIFMDFKKYVSLVQTIDQLT